MAVPFLSPVVLGFRPFRFYGLANKFCTASFGKLHDAYFRLKTTKKNFFFNSPNGASSRESFQLKYNGVVSYKKSSELLTASSMHNDTRYTSRNNAMPAYSKKRKKLLEEENFVRVKTRDYGINKLTRFGFVKRVSNEFLPTTRKKIV